MEPKSVDFSRHALDRMAERGATRLEAVRAVREGERTPANLGRTMFRLHMAGRGMWAGRAYDARLLDVFAIEDSPGDWVVVTVIVKYSWPQQGA